MGTLTITKAYSTSNPLLESHIDNFRNGLLTLVNTDKFNSSNFSGALSLTSNKFTGNQLTDTDDEFISFGATTDAWFGINGDKDWVFDTAANTTDIQLIVNEITALTILTDKINVHADVIIGAGGSGRTILQAVSSYKKPVLEWTGSTTISISNNSPNANETVIMFPTFCVAVDEAITGNAKFRQVDIEHTLNGSGTSDVGAARGGRRSGLSLTTNTWYTVYAVKVRSGSDYDEEEAKFILAFDSTLPISSNESTLNSRYGEGCWVYCGLVRYGQGASGSSNTIPKFVMSNKGWYYFYQGNGIVLAESTSNTDNSSSAFYTLNNGISGQVVPSIVGAVSVQIFRNGVSDWWIEDSNGSDVWRGGWQTEQTSLPHGFIVELPFFDDATCYAFKQTRKELSSVTKRISLVAFCDTMFTLRRQGIGI